MPEYTVKVWEMLCTVLNEENFLTNITKKAQAIPFFGDMNGQWL